MFGRRGRDDSPPARPPMSGARPAPPLAVVAASPAGGAAAAALFDFAPAAPEAKTPSPPAAKGDNVLDAGKR